MYSYYSRCLSLVVIRLVWSRVPKTRFMKYKQFSAAVYDAVVHFKVGNIATLLIYNKLHIDRGCYTTKGCLDKNKTIISTQCGKVARNKRIERKVYGAGIDD